MVESIPGLRLPTELLYDIFGHIYGQLEEVATDKFWPWWPEYAIEMFPRLPRRLSTPLSRTFANLRLVCRSWKPIADEFFFRDFEFRVQSGGDEYRDFKQVYAPLYVKDRNMSERHWTRDHSEITNREIYRNWSLREILLQGQYTELVRHLSIVLRFDDYDPADNEPDNVSEPYAKYLHEYVEFLFKLLRRSTRCISLNISTTLSRDDYSPRSFISMREATFGMISVLHQISEIMPQANLHLKVCFPEIWYLDEQPESTPMRLRIESWIMEDVWNQPLLNNIHVLTLEMDKYVSPALFRSLSNTKRLILLGSYEDRPILDSATISAIRTMKSLRVLETDLIRISQIPDGVTAFAASHLVGGHALSSNFWKEMENLTRLVHLRLDFDRPPIFASDPIPALRSCIDDLFTGFHQLRTFDFRGLHFPSTDYFAQKVLENAPALEYLRLRAVKVTDHILDRMATRSLINLELSLQIRKEIYLPATVPEGLEEQMIHWSSLASLLSRNPRLRDARIYFGHCYTQFGFKDVAAIAQSCPGLRDVHLTFQNPHIPDVYGAEQHIPINPRWIYKSSVPEDGHSHGYSDADELMERSIKASYGNYGKLIHISMELDVIRALYNQALPGRRQIIAGALGGMLGMICADAGRVSRGMDIVCVK